MTTAGARGSLSLVDPDETLPPEAPPTIPAPPPPPYWDPPTDVRLFDLASEELDEP